MSSLTSKGFIAAPGTSTEDKIEISENVDEGALLGKSDDDIPPFQEPKNACKNQGKEPSKRPSIQKTTRESGKRRHSQSADEKISHSEQAINSLKRHTEKGTCLETLQYRARGRIRADTKFKTDIKRIRKNAEQEYVKALTRFHYREIDRQRVEKQLFGVRRLGTKMA